MIVGLEPWDFLFSPIAGMMMQSDELVLFFFFQRDSNHQPV